MKGFNLFIGKFLTSKFIYNALIKPFFINNIFTNQKSKIDLNNQPHFIKSSIFWGIYERSEISLIKRFINKDLPVIELGASIGATSLAILHSVDNQKVVSVEANPRLMPNLLNTNKLNNAFNWTILNYAIDYSGLQEISFEIDEGNLGSHKVFFPAKEHPLIPCKTVKSIYDQFIVNNNFALVSDIEGAEAEFIFEDNNFLKEKCKQMILELHETNFKDHTYTKKDLAFAIVSKCSMKEVFNDGKTWVFENQYLT